MGLIEAQRLSDALPLAEDLIQNPETGAFDLRARPAVKPYFYAVNLEQVADAIEDVLRNPRNGLNSEAPIIFRLKRTVTQYANDPQRVETDFTTQHASLTRQMAVGDLPPSDENLHLQTVLLQGAQGIRATHAEIYTNRRIQQEQALRELTGKDITAIQDAADALKAITEGDLHDQMREDIAALTVDLPAQRPRLAGVTPKDATQAWPNTPLQDEVWRFFGRVARITIALRSGAIQTLRKVSANPIVQAASLYTLLEALIKIGVGLF